MKAWTAALVIGCAAWAAAADPAPPMPTPPTVAAANFDYRLAAREVAPGVYVVAGANADFSISNGCNIINTGFVVTGDGVVVVNTGPSRRYGEQLRELIRRTTAEPLRRVINLNLHPDYFLGNQAFADVAIAATELTRQGMQREARAYEDNLYRVCGDWMAGTSARLPDSVIAAGRFRIGDHDFEWRELHGHTASDGVLIDHSQGLAFVGGLVFSQRIPTTPHAVVADWLASLDALVVLSGQGVTTLVQSHGPVEPGLIGLQQTRAYLRWLDQQFHLWAAQGLEMNDVLRAEVPLPYRQWAAFPVEFARNAAHLYPRYEREALSSRR
jgi:quinoprotein relay system zinc metallohydrolase 1